MIQDIKDFVFSSALTRMLANFFLFVLLFCAVFIGMQEILTNQPISPIVYVIVSSALSYCVTIIGVHVPYSGNGLPKLTPLNTTSTTDTTTTTHTTGNTGPTSTNV